MSIDLIDSSTSTRTRTFQRARVEAALAGHVAGPVVDNVLIFGGWGSENAGGPLDPHAATSTASLVSAVQALPSPSSRRLVVRAREGALNDDGDESFLQLARDFHPLGKLIVYGYSAGGFSALRISYRLGMVFPYWNVGAGRLEPYPPTFGTGSAHVLAGFVRIDRMITIDPASGPTSGMVSRRVWPSVRYNLNVYQTHPASHAQSGGLFQMGVRSHGEPTEAFDATATRIENVDWSSRYTGDPGSAHGRIGRDTIDLVLASIREELAS